MIGSSIEDAIDARVRVAVREEMRGVMREVLAELKPIASGDYLSVVEAARIAGVHPETIRLWIRAGRLPRHKSGREWRVMRAELDAFLKAGDKPPASADTPEERATAILNRTRGG